MKSISFLILTVLLSFHAFSQTGKLIIIVKDIQHQKGGKILTGLFTAGNFPKAGKETAGSSNPVTGNQMQIVFDNIPAGKYGVASFQDIDMNKKMTTNFFGYPVEPFGFSRAAKTYFGPPDFDDAKIEIEADKTITIEITLR